MKDNTNQPFQVGKVKGNFYIPLLESFLCNRSNYKNPSRPCWHITNKLELQSPEGSIFAKLAPPLKDGIFYGLSQKNQQVYLAPIKKVHTDLHYAISSHSHNIPLAYKQVERLINLGVSPQSVIVVLGKSHRDDLKENTWDIEKAKGVRAINSPIAAWEFSTLYSLSKESHSGYWFLIHDTMELGDDFVSQSRNANIVGLPDVIVAGLRKDSHCGYGTWHSLAAYHSSFLKRLEKLFYSFDGISRSDGIEIEMNLNYRGILNYSHRTYFYPNSENIFQDGPTLFYGQQKYYRYFPSIDLKKYFTNGFGENQPLSF